MNDQATGTRQHRVVIVGAGFGGLHAARALGHTPVQVTVIDARNYHLFQPLLYQVATAELSAADISIPIRRILRRQRNTEVLLAEVTGVDVAEQRVFLGDQFIPYDSLILATGAQLNYFGHERWAAFAPGLKSLTDATIIRRRILLAFETAEWELDSTERQRLLTFVIVGGGPTGVELAGAIAELARKSLVRDFRHIDPQAARILLVEAGIRLLDAFPAELAERAQHQLERLGVEVRTNTRVTSVEAASVMIGDQRFPTKTVIWAAGVRASPVGHWLGAEVDRAGRVRVERDLTIPGHPEIFVIGDSASTMEHGNPLPGLAPVAMQQGRYVANVLRRRLAGKPTKAPFHYRDKGDLATVGRAFAVADLRRIQLSGVLAWLVWVIVHIAYLIGFRNRLLVLIQWAWSYLTYQPGAQIILEAPAPPLSVSPSEPEREAVH